MKFKLFSIVCIVLVFLSSKGLAQKADSSKRLIFSFGVRANTFLLSDFAMKNIPPARLQLNFDITKFLRFEAQYGFNKTVADNPVSQPGSSGTTTYINYPTTDNTSLWSTGLFFMKKIDKVNFYFGARYGRASYADQHVTYFGSGYTVISNSGKVGLISGALGGEYFFARRFSFAGEFAFVHMKDTYTVSNPSAPDFPAVITNNNLTETSLILRFYPF